MVSKGIKRLVYFLIGIIFFSFSINGNDIEDSNKISEEKPVIINPVLIGSLSLVPGGGQLYSKHYIKAGLFLGSEIVLGSIALFWHNTKKERENYSLSYQYLSEIAPTKKDSLALRELSSLWNYDAIVARYNRDNALAWFFGAYVFNILDALECSNYFKNDEKKEPVKAAYFGIIPGGGQIYNGAFSKAGFIIMTQVCLGIISLHEHLLMKEAERRYSKLISMKDSTGNSLLLPQYKDDWEWRRSTAFRNRNMYLWYSLFFYVYSILDGVVDAHLHDFSKKIEIKPDLIVSTKEWKINVCYEF